MSDYPRWLVERVASAGAMAVDDTTLYGDDPRYPQLVGKGHSRDYINEWEQGAVAILNELGFYHTYPDSPFWEAHTREP